MRRLCPEPTEGIEPLDAYADLPPAEGRPAVRLNMIASLDGATAVDGTSGALGGPADRRVYLALRALADVVLVAAGTVRAEGYGPPSLPGDLAAARRRAGRNPAPASPWSRAPSSSTGTRTSSPGPSRARGRSC